MEEECEKESGSKRKAGDTEGQKYNQTVANRALVGRAFLVNARKLLSISSLSSEDDTLVFQTDACLGLQLLCLLLESCATQQTADDILLPAFQSVWGWVLKLNAENGQEIDKRTRQMFIKFVLTLMVYDVRKFFLLLEEQGATGPVLNFVLENVTLIKTYENTPKGTPMI
ncbi:putative importin-beta amine-terminal domain protein [Toxoplasma gondii TgCatPRC2]|uniref:Putative importin-beta amine-terminal domain protein n=1 Tax=Toxoplasma gondii TgCatPRC2 TaxID=1130821 RepID=A0A151HQQ1_TOXGO|nr:putative importin-beta amine-terminal domain protein [Toxoplasma gondii TgCatPRC2]